MKDECKRRILITGGAGFIGSNLAERLLGEAEVEVRIFDNLSRPGVEHNLAWLKNLPGCGRMQFIRGDIRNAEDVRAAVEGVHEIYHLAAQVAVTTSIQDPRQDFEVNALGTLNVLEAARASKLRPFLLFTSTNKVYGALDGVPVHRLDERYCAQDAKFTGVSEREPLDFYSPYGCSKGSADQYVRDYARIYDLPFVTFRMSCIAGPRQFGTEDQGWLAHFLYSTLENREITIYGDGCQVRDILHVSELIDAMQAVREHADIVSGEVYNVGGGMQRAASILEMLKKIEELTGMSPRTGYAEVRTGDQPLYISDTGKLTRHTGWMPSISCEDTLRAIHRFWLDQGELLTRHRAMPAAAEPVEVAR